MIGATSGGLGDIVYSIPVMHKLKVDKLYVKENYYFPPYGSLYLSCKSLLAQQGIEVLPTSGAYVPHKFDPTITFDYDFDRARLQPRRGRNHIIVSYLNDFQLSHDNWTDPWLKVEGEGLVEGNYAVVHRTERWRRWSTLNWAALIRGIPYDKVLFVGFDYEFDAFCREIGPYAASRLQYFPTQDILQMAIVIRDSEALYSNQSVSLTLAQGLGKTYFLERNVNKTNCIMKTQNENLLC